MPNPQAPRPPNPLWISAGISVGVLLLTHMLQLLGQKELYFLNRISLGYDLKYVWDAAVRMSEGTSPYVFEDFVWPTLAPWVLWKSGLMGVGLAALAKGMFFLSLGALLLSCHLANRLFSDIHEDNSDNIAPLLLLVFSSFPVYFLLDRGNLDGLTLAFMWGGLWFGFRARSSHRQEMAGGLLLAVAIGIKIYPMVLLAPLLVFRKIRIIIGVAIGMALIVALDHQGWRVFVAQRLWSRVAGTDWCGLFNENASLEAFYLIVIQVVKNAGAQVSALVPTLLARLTAGLLLAVALGSTFLLRHDRDRRVQLAWIYSFIPVTLATPSASLAYVLTNVIPVAICARFLLTHYRRARYARIALLLVFVGIGLGQFQAIALTRLVEHPGRVARMALRAGGMARQAQLPGSTSDVVSAFCSVGSFITVLSLAAFQVVVTWPIVGRWIGRIRSSKGTDPAG